MKHFLTLSELQPKQIHEILNLADQLKYEKQHHISHPLLQGKTLGIVPGSSSSRTRICLEVGMYDLGGRAVSMPADSLCSPPLQGRAAFRCSTVHRIWRIPAGLWRI